MGLTIGQKVKIVDGEFAGITGVIEVYYPHSQTFTVLVNGDELFGEYHVSVACAHVRFL